MKASKICPDRGKDDQEEADITIKRQLGRKRVRDGGTGDPRENKRKKGASTHNQEIQREQTVNLKPQSEQGQG